MFWRTLVRVEGLKNGMLTAVIFSVTGEGSTEIPINMVDDTKIKSMLEINTEWPIRLFVKIDYTDKPHILKLYDFELAPEPDEDILTTGQ